jgi:hypothetical protein
LLREDGYSFNAPIFTGLREYVNEIRIVPPKGCLEMLEPVPTIRFPVHGGLDCHWQRLVAISATLVVSDGSREVHQLVDYSPFHGCL